MVSFEELIRLNRYAQGARPSQEASAWFSDQDAKKKRDLLRALVTAIHQAHPLPGEVHEAIERSGLKPTYTACVLLAMENFPMQAAKVISLPESEWDKSFRLLIALLSVADARRRAGSCARGCTHWWHQDLSKSPAELRDAAEWAESGPMARSSEE